MFARLPIDLMDAQFNSRNAKKKAGSISRLWKWSRRRQPPALCVRWHPRGDRVLDVGCGTGVVAITAARLGAKVRAVDLTPELLERARENAGIAKVDIEWTEADVEKLPFRDAEFDVVVSQFAHMFAPRPEIAAGEMLRVLRPGGTLGFATWPPELMVGRTMVVSSR